MGQQAGRVRAIGRREWPVRGRVRRRRPRSVPRARPAQSGRGSGRRRRSRRRPAPPATTSRRAGRSPRPGHEAGRGAEGVAGQLDLPCGGFGEDQPQTRPEGGEVHAVGGLDAFRRRLHAVAVPGGAGRFAQRDAVAGLGEGLDPLPCASRDGHRAVHFCAAPIGSVRATVRSNSACFSATALRRRSGHATAGRGRTAASTARSRRRGTARRVRPRPRRAGRARPGARQCRSGPGRGGREVVQGGAQPVEVVPVAVPQGGADSRDGEEEGAGQYQQIQPAFGEFAAQGGEERVHHRGPGRSRVGAQTAFAHTGAVDGAGRGGQ